MDPNILCYCGTHTFKYLNPELNPTVFYSQKNKKNNKQTNSNSSSDINICIKDNYANVLLKSHKRPAKHCITYVLKNIVKEPLHILSYSIFPLKAKMCTD